MQFRDLGAVCIGSPGLLLRRPPMRLVEGVRDSCRESLRQRHRIQRSEKLLQDSRAMQHFLDRNDGDPFETTAPEARTFGLDVPFSTD